MKMELPARGDVGFSLGDGRGKTVQIRWLAITFWYAVLGVLAGYLYSGGWGGERWLLVVVHGIGLVGPYALMSLWYLRLSSTGPEPMIRFFGDFTPPVSLVVGLLTIFGIGVLMVFTVEELLGGAVMMGVGGATMASLAVAGLSWFGEVRAAERYQVWMTAADSLGLATGLDPDHRLPRMRGDYRGRETTVRLEDSVRGVGTFVELEVSHWNDSVEIASQGSPRYRADEGIVLGEDGGLRVRVYGPEASTIAGQLEAAGVDQLFQRVGDDAVSIEIGSMGLKIRHDQLPTLQQQLERWIGEAFEMIDRAETVIAADG